MQARLVGPAGSRLRTQSGTNGTGQGFGQGGLQCVPTRRHHRASQARPRTALGVGVGRRAEVPVIPTRPNPLDDTRTPTASTASHGESPGGCHA
jgi:hypothetical protein